MTPEDIEKIADVLIEKIHEKKNTFWVDPESHYLDHKAMKEHSFTHADEADLRQLIGMFQTARGLFFKSFVGLAIIGAVALAGYGAFKELIK